MKTTMLFMRAGACMGLIIDATICVLITELVHALWMGTLAIVICPVWDDFQ